VRTYIRVCITLAQLQAGRIYIMYIVEDMKICPSACVYGTMLGGSARKLPISDWCGVVSC